jgi:hypothetical protein
MRRVILLLAFTGCGDNRACDPTAEHCEYEKAVSTLDIAAGHEDEDTCQSWTLNNPTELWVSAVSQHNDGGYHHANWFFVPDNQFVQPDGAWSCSQASFDELTAALLGGYLFAMSTQSHDETQTLPTGYAIRIPPYSRVIGASHLQNASDSDIESTMTLTIDTVPLTEVIGKLAPARIQYLDLHLDAASKSSFTTECLIDDSYTKIMHAPLNYKLLYTLSHYHTLGTYTQLEIAGGPHDGEVIMRHDGTGNNAGVAIDPPVDLGALGARGVRLTCGYDNPRAVSVGWGIGDQEMCVMALQAVTDIGWAGDVLDGTSVKGGVNAGEIQYSGPCSLTAFPWDFTKAGGPPR